MRRKFKREDRIIIKSGRFKGTEGIVSSFGMGRYCITSDLGIKHYGEFWATSLSKI